MHSSYSMLLLELGFQHLSVCQSLNHSRKSLQAFYGFKMEIHITWYIESECPFCCIAVGIHFLQKEYVGQELQRDRLLG